MNRLQKLEAAVKAAIRLRSAIESPGKVPRAALLVPVEEVKHFDDVMDSLREKKE